MKSKVSDKIEGRKKGGTGEKEELKEDGIQSSFKERVKSKVSDKAR